MCNAILIICTANICRSPLGERLLRHHLPHKTIDSAGMVARSGRSADPDIKRVANRHKVSLDGHQSRQFTAALSTQYDLILVMEKEHLKHIAHIAPEARSKSMLLGYWFNQMEIPDPWHQSDEAFNHVFQLINQSCQAWVSKLAS
ncbi:protein tyrosine phosphatase [Scandinavium sp. V105_16]|uniref:protein-tyrosine-phosphatase n=1 Tax=Scandinavium lactucae TaxID=3095028 RepID=A0AAJ2S646_9ENTR|nr:MULTISPECIES: protein tyrosine phosphatase [unclassified Scandinavium]MDX6019193.1 protein tyrosine phosphatase [Scandinavium sp. V105_16]MDX6030651.1 protein tyrosine phosphatase [Scandinavium sp. V105_12]